MQKNSVQASILIWAIFLSLIMSVSFISISTKINKTIHNNQKSQDEINTYISNLNNDLDVLSSEKYFIQQESPHIFYYSFKKNESINLSFS
jgi:peptidoglycan hydrolase CwlO-like protein